MYDARVGRFLSEDPIGDDPINEFRYVGNHPTYATDPSGLEEIERDGEGLLPSGNR